MHFFHLNAFNDLLIIFDEFLASRLCLQIVDFATYIWRFSLAVFASFQAKICRRTSSNHNLQYFTSL